MDPKIQSCSFCLKIGAHSISCIQIPNPDSDFWNFDPKTHFWANFGQKSQSCLFFLKIGTHGILTMLILIPTLVFWIVSLKSIFGQIWIEKVKVVVLPEIWDTCTYTRSISKMFILIFMLVFWNSKPKSIFLTKLSRKNWILYFVWKLVHRVSSGCDWKNTEQCLEEKIKMISCIKCLLLLYLIVAKSKKLNQSTKECWINGIIVAI